MRIPRLYVPGLLAEGHTVTLGAEATHYLTKVLRLLPGREIVVFNGGGAEYGAILMECGKRSATIAIETQHAINRESPLQSHLAIGISRGERMDWVLQKATELGVTSVTPLFTERTEVKLRGDRLAKKQQHWQQVMISACEQCQRNTLPQLEPSQSFNEFVRNHSSALKLVLHHRSDQSITQLAKPAAVTLLVGPEGGLSADEIDQSMNQHYYHPLTLGPRVLRTETAPIVALSTVQLLWGDLA